MKLAIAAVLIAGLIVSTCAHAQRRAIPTDWWLVDQTLDARTLEVKSEKRLQEFVKWDECIRAQAGRMSKVTGGVAHIFLCRHYEGEVST